MNSGELLGFWVVPNELRTMGVLNAFYDDTAARVQISVLVETLHPYSDNKAVFIVKGPRMDVLGLTNSGVALISFWERLVIVGMIAVILALFLR